MSNTSLLDLAERLVAKWGRNVTLVQAVPATPDTNAWDGSTAGTATQTVKAVFLDPGNAEQNFDFSEKMIPKTATTRADYHLIVAAQGSQWEPTQGCKVIDGSRSFQVVTVSPIQPGDVTFLYVLQVQK